MYKNCAIFKNIPTRSPLSKQTQAICLCCSRSSVCGLSINIVISHTILNCPFVPVFFVYLSFSSILMPSPIIILVGMKASHKYIPNNCTA